MGKKDERRRIYMIDRSFQVRFIVKFCLLVAAAGVLTIGVVYFLCGRSTTVSILHSKVVVRSTADYLLPLLVQTVLVVMVLVSVASAAVTLFVSHKIAGPLYRLRKAMQEVAGGNLSAQMKLRQADQLQEVAVSFNDMVKRLKERFSA